MPLFRYACRAGPSADAGRTPRLLPLESLTHRRALPAEAVERIARKLVAAADLRHRAVFVEHADHCQTVLGQHVELRETPLAAPQHNPLGLAARQGLLGAHRYQVALDLGHQSERETQHLAVDRIVECVSLLGRVEVDLLLQAPPHDRHDVGECPAQPRNLGHDQRIAPFHPPEQRSQLAVTFARLAAHDLRNPHIHFPIPVLRKTPDLILLVGRMLSLRTNP